MLVLYVSARERVTMDLVYVLATCEEARGSSGSEAAGIAKVIGTLLGCQ